MSELKVEYVEIEKLKEWIITKSGIKKIRYIKFCLSCGKKFLVTKCYLKRKYCSRKCSLQINSIKNLKDWTIPQKIAERNKEKWFRKLVSKGLKKYYQKHRLKFLQGKQRTDWRISTWKAIRIMVLERHQYQCARCGNIRRLDVHHFIPERAGGENALKNLLPLCRKCHQFIEKNQLGIYRIVKNWNIVAILMRDSFLLNIK